MRTTDELLGLSGRIWNRLCKFGLFRRAAWRFVEPLDPERWIFIIGCYNSGTTLLQRLLWHHPAIRSMGDEGVRYTDQLERPEHHGWTRMWHRCEQAMRVEPGPGARERADRIKRDWSLIVGDGAANVLEKSVANTARVPFLAEHFQPAYFIYLVRNGYVVSEGIRRKARPGEWGNTRYPSRYPIELCARQWVETDRVVEREAPGSGRLLTVYYEDLTEEPARELRRITSWLGLQELPISPGNRTWHIHGRAEEVRNMNPESFDRLSDEDTETITGVAGERLEKHGYPTLPR